MKIVSIILAVTCVLASAQTTKPTSRPGGEIVAPARREVPGKKIATAAGELFVPDFYQAREKVDVVIWSLGATWCVEQSFYDARRNCVLLTLSNATRSAGLGETAKFDAVIKAVADAMGKPAGRICLGSFSGGYVTPREILRNKELADRESDVVLADSLYAPRKDDVLDDAAMKPFLDFAKRAVDGKATFVFSQLYPPEEKYRNNTTTLAAVYLTDKLHVPREPGSGKSSRGAKILYRAEEGNFHVLGYAGMMNQDHFDHLYGMADLLRMTSFEEARGE